jgi:archaellum component FlaC
MDNNTLIDAIATAVLAKIGQNTINSELDMIRSEMTAIHNRILALTNKIDTADSVIADCLLDVSRLEMTVEGMDEAVTRDDVQDIINDTLSGATFSINV